MRWAGTLVAVSLVCWCACGGGSSVLPNISVYVGPLTANVGLGATQQFTATTSGYNDTSVIWYVNGVKGGNSTYGTVTQAGLYTAPATAPNPATVSVTVISAKNSSDMASASVNISIRRDRGDYPVIG